MSTRSSIVKWRLLNFRIVSVTPWMLHGGMTAATRLPSGSRESRMGFWSEMSSPSRRAMFLTATIRDFSLKREVGYFLKYTSPLDEDAVRAVDHDFADGVVAGSGARWVGEMEGWFRIRALEFTSGELFEVRAVHIVVVGLQVAEHRRHRIQAVVGDGHRLGVLEFRERLHVEAEVAVGVVAL